MSESHAGCPGYCWHGYWFAGLPIFRTELGLLVTSETDLIGCRGKQMGLTISVSEASDVRLDAAALITIEHCM